VLLDTHALIWATMTPALLSRPAAAAIADAGNIKLVSAACAWEIATKVRAGRLPGVEILEREFFETIDIAGYSLLPIDVASALRAGRLIGVHRDPFDRMIAAQALELDVDLISKDAKMDEFGVRRIW
jgi:PIN domain nuclease of toxin-antitoxin system